jgi:hypothetical protein
VADRDGYIWCYSPRGVNAFEEAIAKFRPTLCKGCANLVGAIIPDAYAARFRLPPISPWRAAPMAMRMTRRAVTRMHGPVVDAANA